MNYLNKKIGSIFIIFCVAVCGIISYNVYSDYEIIKDNIIGNQDNIKDQLDSYIKTTFCDTNEYLKVILSNKTQILQDNIVLDYKDNEALLENDVIHPTQYSLLSKNIDKELGNNKNKIFIANSNNIIWTTFDGKKTDNLLTWEDTILPTRNETLNRKSIDIIKTGDVQNYDLIFYQKEFSNLNVYTMNIDDLVKELRNNNYNLNELKSYEILIPVYITEDGDIFGVKDINSLGQVNKNYKLYVVESINMYSIIKNHMINIQQYLYDIEYDSGTLNYAQKSKATLLFGIIAFIIGVMILSAAIQNKK